ncbi:SUKH-4 family immunity protein [Streptomyces griseoincarnatus]|uniref:SUKH-4 family immunity protein n=1 Tax=Streptomyces sp. PAM3C TaxID=2847300 RepID=UPI001C1E8382|nr:SUKH-4 family immunity protein [Streptomyces sp. PAM3C]MBU5944232.1 SUKH-4 family immunity protein [Streptomyces sp. PAM3C]
MDVTTVTIPVDGESRELCVAAEFLAYAPLDRAERVSSLDGRTSLIRFGVIGRATHVFLDERTGWVVSGFNAADVALMNTSLDRFVECVARLAAFYPYYSAESDDEEWEMAAMRVQQVICEVDAAAYREGSFWYDFRWDVTQGDFYE